MAAATLMDVQDIFQAVITQFENLKTKITGDKACDDKQYEKSIDEFWKLFANTNDVVSHEATKLCTVFNEPPLPAIEGVETLLNDLEKAVSQLVLLYFLFPTNQGKTIRSNLHKFISLVVTSVEELCVCIKNSSANTLQIMGVVWERCKALDTLPKDNKEAVLYIFQTEETLVTDAKDELKDSIDNDTEADDDDRVQYAFMQNGIRLLRPDRWTEFDRLLVRPGLKLIEIYGTCLVKVKKVIDEGDFVIEEGSNAEIDAVSGLVRYSSSTVDNFVTSLYPPTSIPSILHHASILKKKIIDLLTWLESSSYCTESLKMFVTLFQDAANTYWGNINERIAS